MLLLSHLAGKGSSVFFKRFEANKTIDRCSCCMLPTMTQVLSQNSKKDKEPGPWPSTEWKVSARLVGCVFVFLSKHFAHFLCCELVHQVLTLESCRNIVAPS